MITCTQLCTNPLRVFDIKTSSEVAENGTQEATLEIMKSYHHTEVLKGCSGDTNLSFWVNLYIGQKPFFFFWFCRKLLCRNNCHMIIKEKVSGYNYTTIYIKRVSWTEHDRTRTCNPQIRSLVPYPLGHMPLLHNTCFQRNHFTNLPSAAFSNRKEIFWSIEESFWKSLLENIHWEDRFHWN